MSDNTDTLRDIFLDVSDETTLTETQDEGPSREPIGRTEAEMEQKLSGLTRADGLDEAVDGPDAVTG